MQLGVCDDVSIRGPRDALTMRLRAMAAVPQMNDRLDDMRADNDDPRLTQLQDGLLDLIGRVLSVRSPLSASDKLEFVGMLSRPSVVLDPSRTIDTLRRFSPGHPWHDVAVDATALLADYLADDPSPSRPALRLVPPVAAPVVPKASATPSPVRRKRRARRAVATAGTASVSAAPTAVESAEQGEHVALTDAQRDVLALLAQFGPKPVIAFDQRALAACVRRGLVTKEHTTSVGCDGPISWLCAAITPEGMAALASSS